MCIDLSKILVYLNSKFSICILETASQYNGKFLNYIKMYLTSEITLRSMLKKLISKGRKDISYRVQKFKALQEYPKC